MRADTITAILKKNPWHNFRRAEQGDGRITCSGRQKKDDPRNHTKPDEMDELFCAVSNGFVDRFTSHFGPCLRARWCGSWRATSGSGSALRAWKTYRAAVPLLINRAHTKEIIIFRESLNCEAGELANPTRVCPRGRSCVPPHYFIASQIRLTVRIPLQVCVIR